MGPLSNGRLAVALAVLSALALFAWRTMEPGRYLELTWLLLGFFAFRIVLARAGAGKIKNGRNQNANGPYDV